MVDAVMRRATPDASPMNRPSTNGAGNGRDKNGRFSRGNFGGPGNPFAKRVARLRSIVLKTATPERMRTLVETLFDRAIKNGDMAAAGLLLKYLIPQPASVSQDMELLGKLARAQLEGWRAERELTREQKYDFPDLTL